MAVLFWVELRILRAVRIPVRAVDKIALLAFNLRNHWTSLARQALLS
jgi:hypothetical protein